MSVPLVAIVGRPNVGKSSLFNRLLRRRVAIVDPSPGVTRDRNYQHAEWSGVQFDLVDTGGMVPSRKDQMERVITEQAEYAIREADLILFVTDVQVGIEATEERLARRLLQSGRTVRLIVNKVDNDAAEQSAHEFHSLGLGEPIPVSATAGRGIGDLLDQIVEIIRPKAAEEQQEQGIRVAVVGRPNVGKSSFINQLLGEDRHIVSPVAGTTRDSVHSRFEFNGQHFLMIDTAGLRAKSRVSADLEYYTALRTFRALEECDVAVQLIDAVDGMTTQDQKILSQIFERRRAAVLVVNKWDLVEKDSKTADEFSKAIQEIIAQYDFLPIIFISAKTGQRVEKVLTLVTEVYLEHYKRLSTPVLNDFLSEVTAMRQPPARQGKMIKFSYMTQSEVAPPTFVFFCTHPRLLDPAYARFLSNQLRERFGFRGVPIRLKFQKK